ncbi:response regulator [Mucilaginibacter flavus]|uniref:response regulator n=1 Tax=Mucilaginibacter flavus TaxID=931504 RepID=UPI0025B3A015|nr:response regulator [Mucilaginibacter flavus]MDN3580797.1 response regulator [Mucilaginibacter flavus]
MKPKDITSNILVIDDGEIDNYIFETVLKKVLINSKFDTCMDGQSAIDKLISINRTTPHLFPDFIFLDLTMPMMNGWQFLEEFSRLNIDPLKKSKIYVLSSSVSNLDRSRSLLNPLVVDFISKPINRDKIQSIFEVS